ncbi:CHAP domain-containing protein [Candidatus Saccharibacteria bacterium]|nr:CHAP domain-containing protein [Candidatus Saccharibacteria bacterium]
MKIWRNISYLSIAATIIFASSFTLPAAAYTQADLREVNEKISEIRAEISGYEEEAAALSAQAATILGQIALLQNKQALLRKQIELKQAEHDQLVIDIEATQKTIDQNSETIGYVVAQYYYNDGVSTLERLVSADSFSSYVDEEVRLTSISDTIVEIVNENKRLKEELEGKKREAESILRDLETQKEELRAAEAEQNRLLAETRNSEAEYQRLKGEADQRKKALEDEQQRIIDDLARQNNATNIAPGDPNKGGYPYSSQCPAAKLNGMQYIDRWGMYICECVSYAAWRVYNKYGYMPYWGGHGNANQWLNNARAAGYTVSSTPKPGSVGISLAGVYRHAVWVEAVSGNRVYISQYNARNQATGWLPGEYSEQWIDRTAYTYIYFH